MKYGFIPFILMLGFLRASALSDTTDIPLSRQGRHEDIHTEQINCDRLDGKIDGMLRAGNNESVNIALTEALIRKPNEFRQWIEKNDAQLPTNNDKVRYLRYVSEVLISFRTGVKAKQITITELPDLLATFEKIMKAKAAGSSFLPYLVQSTYRVAKINAQIFSDTADAHETDAIIYQKYAALHSDLILQTIEPFATEPYADSLIILACTINPVQFYNYAQSPNSIVGRLIHRSTNPMVMKVAELSQTDNALLYFPFLDDLLSGRQGMDDIKKNIDDSVSYYKLLVNTATAYSRRMAAPLKDTPVAYFGDNGLWQTLYKKAKFNFINPINDLHDESNLSVRMRAIQPLSAAELYYMLVTGENDIYTSSYKHSFDRMMQLMGPKPRGDSLLLTVNFDHFRKFIKMAANYNKLDTFLKTMPPNRSAQLMTAFVAHLDNKNLEDAVDVADSYSSITNPKLQQSMLANVIQNENDAIAADNRNGKIVYGLLKTIFLSADKKNGIDLSSEFGIPPIYDVSNIYMQDDKNRIVEEVFFYGDKDGKAFYPPFRNSFSGSNWKVTEKKEWMEAYSAKGNVWVFANKPLDSDANLDDSAQAHLNNYLADQGMKPSLVVHRGHSYWLSHTMSRMPGDAKIVILGSCGGYQNLNQILEINPDAHIISTKEIGTGDINLPILSYINDVFTNYGNLTWPKMWQTLTKDFEASPSKAVRESWDDYIPPYKNLGAIFLKAYNKKMEEE